MRYIYISYIYIHLAYIYTESENSSPPALSPLPHNPNLLFPLPHNPLSIIPSPPAGMALPVLLCLLVSASTLVSATVSVGAIRWDAWYGAPADKNWGMVGRAVTNDLSPARYAPLQSLLSRNSSSLFPALCQDHPGN